MASATLNVQRTVQRGPPAGFAGEPQQVGSDIALAADAPRSLPAIRKARLALARLPAASGGGTHEFLS